MLQVSKYKDVVITSLKLTPKKFTKTMLPAVSMDVLRGEQVTYAFYATWHDSMYDSLFD